MKIDKRKGRVIKYSKELLADIFTFFEDLRKGQRSRFDNDSMRVDSDVGLKYHRFKTEDKEIYGISYLSKKYKYEKIKKKKKKKKNYEKNTPYFKIIFFLIFFFINL